MLDALRAQAVTAEGDGYLQWDDMAVELETAEFLYGLVRLTKPRVVVEGGSGRGIASAFLTEALRGNGSGFLYTYEPEDRFLVETRERLAGLPAEVRPGTSLTHTGPDPDLVFLDSGPDHRPAEIQHWLDTPATRKFTVVVHDAYRYALTDGLYLKTPRGLWLGHR